LNTIKNRSRSFHKRWSVTRYYVDTVQAMVSDTVICWHCPSDGQWHGIMLTLSKRWSVTRYYVDTVKAMNSDTVLCWPSSFREDVL